MDIARENLPLIGGGAILLGGLALWLVRRRRAQPAKRDEPVKLAPTMATAISAPVGSAVSGSTAAASAVPTMVAAAEAGELDPMEEAKVYLSHGRDAQAEATLKEAVAKNPRRHDMQVALLEIYAARKDKAAFAKQAVEFHNVSGDHAESWLRVAAMGYALDPQNPLFAAGKNAPAPAPIAAEAPAVDLDFDLDAAAPGDKAGSVPDAGFKIDVPPAEPERKPDTARGAQEPAPALDFNLDLPKVDAPQSGAPAQTKQGADADVDFRLDFGNINLNLDDKQPGAAPGGDRDAHWYDVQQKFDLAKVYQEMGEKDNAREILEEVMKEGNAEQQAEAKALRDNLG
jgi:pilus assembly protein FimV